MNPDLMKAILSMDAYNRGYNAGIQITEYDQNNNIISTQIGDVTIETSTDATGKRVYSDSSLITNGNDQNISFYALAYNYNGETVISYRGTDDFTSDANHGWTLGGGNYRAPQGIMALKFYNEVTGNLSDTRLSDVSFIGHSLGGGLAGYVGANDNLRIERDAA